MSLKLAPNLFDINWQHGEECSDQIKATFDTLKYERVYIYY